MDAMTAHVHVRRVVPDLVTRDPAAATEFYRSLLGLDVAMELGWVTTLVSGEQQVAQLNLVTRDASAAVDPDVSVGVDDVDAAYAVAVESGADIVHGLTDEPWGVRRFFVRDPDGHVVNVVRHR